MDARPLLATGYLVVIAAGLLTIVRLKRRQAELRRDLEEDGALVIICDRGWRHQPRVRPGQ